MEIRKIAGRRTDTKSGGEVLIDYTGRIYDLYIIPEGQYWKMVWEEREEDE
jgi:hypothetical protein